MATSFGSHIASSRAKISSLFLIFFLAEERSPTLYIEGPMDMTMANTYRPLCIQWCFALPPVKCLGWCWKLSLCAEVLLPRNWAHTVLSKATIGVLAYLVSSWTKLLLLVCSLGACSHFPVDSKPSQVDSEDEPSQWGNALMKSVPPGSICPITSQSCHQLGTKSSTHAISWPNHNPQIVAQSLLRILENTS